MRLFMDFGFCEVSFLVGDDENDALAQRCASFLFNFIVLFSANILQKSILAPFLTHCVIARTDSTISVKTKGCSHDSYKGLNQKTRLDPSRTPAD